MLENESAFLEQFHKALGKEEPTTPPKRGETEE
jgi:hypothetical protein